MLAIIAEIHKYHQNLRPDDAGEDSNDTQVPELVRIKALLAAEPYHQHKAEDEA
jgi:hypothetical protein